MSDFGLSKHCPQTGKILIVMVFSIVFSCILSAINIQKNIINDDFFKAGIVINVIQTLYTLNLVYIDLFDKCKSNSREKCGGDCKWYKISPTMGQCRNGEVLTYFYGYIYLIVFLITSIYLILFGIKMISLTESQQDSEVYNSRELILLTIASLICGFIGILFISSDIFVMVFC
jgi:hypothetical protein